MFLSMRMAAECGQELYKVCLKSSEYYGKCLVHSFDRR